MLVCFLYFRQNLYLNSTIPSFLHSYRTHFSLFHLIVTISHPVYLSLYLLLFVTYSLPFFLAHLTFFVLFLFFAPLYNPFPESLSSLLYPCLPLLSCLSSYVTHMLYSILFLTYLLGFCSHSNYLLLRYILNLYLSLSTYTLSEICSNHSHLNHMKLTTQNLSYYLYLNRALFSPLPSFELNRNNSLNQLTH